MNTNLQIGFCLGIIDFKKGKVTLRAQYLYFESTCN